MLVQQKRTLRIDRITISKYFCNDYQKGKKKNKLFLPLLWRELILLSWSYNNGAADMLHMGEFYDMLVKSAASQIVCFLLLEKCKQRPQDCFSETLQKGFLFWVGSSTRNLYMPFKFWDSMSLTILFLLKSKCLNILYQRKDFWNVFLPTLNSYNKSWTDYIIC